MKENKAWLRQFFLFFLGSFVFIPLLGCETPWYQVSQKSWLVGNVEIHEKIEGSKNNWPDRIYKRTYWLSRNDKISQVGTYQSEAMGGIASAPFLLNECILIPSSCFVYMIKANNEVKVFNPSMAQNWSSLDSKTEISQFYDYKFESIEKTSNGWSLLYSKISQERNIPDKIKFHATENWEKFKIVFEE